MLGREERSQKQARTAVQEEWLPELNRSNVTARMSALELNAAGTIALAQLFMAQFSLRKLAESLPQQNGQSCIPSRCSLRRTETHCLKISSQKANIAGKRGTAPETSKTTWLCQINKGHNRALPGCWDERYSTEGTGAWSRSRQTPNSL